MRTGRKDWYLAGTPTAPENPLFIFVVVYAVFILASLGTVAVNVRLNSVDGLVLAATFWSIYITLGNFSAYSARKGIIFRPGHAHFVFTAPIDPKIVLLSSAWMNYLTSLIIWLLFALGGVTVFQVGLWRTVLLFLFGWGLETLLEISVMIFLYANDRLPEKLIRAVCIGIRVFLVAFTLLIVFYLKLYGLSVETVVSFAAWPGLQMIPVIGWQVAAYRMILLGPDTLNIICGCLYLITVILATIGAYKMRCNGGYYEEAAKFADDYAEMKKRRKNGEAMAGIGGKKKKFRTVREQITGKGAKALFYRQFLEYRKEKYFIFSKTTLISLVLAVVLSFTLRDTAEETGNMRFYLLGIVAYVSLVMSGYIGKWENELKSPYLYLIPDTPGRKLWYSTLMEYVKALADGCVICIPVGIAWKVDGVSILFCIAVFTVLQANKIYAKVITRCIAGEIFKENGQNIIRMLIQTAVLGMGALAALFAGMFLDMDFIFPILLIYSIIVTGAMGLLASLRFETMEQL